MDFRNSLFCVIRVPDTELPSSSPFSNRDLLPNKEASADSENHVVLSIE